jgi:DNA-binding NarL/FixJ family response regulator
MSCGGLPLTNKVDLNQNPARCTLPQEGMESSIKAKGICERLAALSDRQRKIVILVGRGLSNRLIADELVVSERTIKNYLLTIYRTLGVQSRFELMVMLSNRNEMQPTP